MRRTRLCGHVCIRLDTLGGTVDKPQEARDGRPATSRRQLKHRSPRALTLRTSRHCCTVSRPSNCASSTASDAISWSSFSAWLKRALSPFDQDNYRLPLKHCENSRKSAAACRSSLSARTARSRSNGVSPPALPFFVWPRVGSSSRPHLLMWRSAFLPSCRSMPWAKLGSPGRPAGSRHPSAGTAACASP